MSALPNIPLLRRSFFFLRHGESVANRADVIAGVVNSPLTPDGKAQALRAAALLAGENIGSVFSSTLRRAAETAVPVASAHGLPVACLSELGERGWGVLEERPLAERTGGPTAEVAEAEPWDAFVARTWAALGRIDGQAPFCIVAHSGTLRALRQGLGIGDESKISNAEPVVFEPVPGEQGLWRYRPVRSSV